MPPKKQQQKSKSKNAPKSKPNTSNPKPAPKLQISAENERRLRRLLLNTDRPAAPPHADTSSRVQKAKRLRTVYDKLSLEGFSSDQIEQALSALNDTATFETALDWLCLNITGSELPLKFSSAGSASTQEGAERSVKIVSTARTDWVPPQRVVDESQSEKPGVVVRVKGRRDEVSLDSEKSLQADWIRQYMEQEEEEQEEVVGVPLGSEYDQSARVASISKEYHRARLGALEAERKGNKRRQDHFTDVIYKLKEELSSLGLSESILNFQDDCANSAWDGLPFQSLESEALEDASGSGVDLDAYAKESLINTNVDESSRLRQAATTADLLGSSSEVGEKNEEPEELELDNLFSEEYSLHEAAIPSGILRHPKKGKSPELAYGHTLGNIDEIWKKGDSGKMPKAVLQKLCQKLGWEAPKYNKLLERENKFAYAVSILRKSTGRGKSRKAGGLITIQLPYDDEAFDFVEDAQNKVAAFALCQLFSDLPLDQLLTKSYSSFVTKWQDEFSSELKDTDDIRREDFVDSLLGAASGPLRSLDATETYRGEMFEEPDKLKIYRHSPTEKTEVTKSVNTGMNYHEQKESISLKKELENKMKLPKYKEMLEARATLPIAKLKNRLLQLLDENDVIVVCGETGCGKTTQVPQFILDDMIQSGFGGSCNIVCTQPRRIAAISVAERVSNERCESSPGSDSSLVGYQVRLDSARNEKTKLLFCTTGILLRKLAANKDLVSVTHVIVDEVHERSLLGDFLLIVLKKLIQKQFCHGGRKLKVILMSATVDSNLFSRYFGNCPVITAEGRTHPVSTYFLEDVYEKLGYSLPSDSYVSGAHVTPKTGKPRRNSVDNHRGKRNLVLSAWGDESLVSEDYINPYYIPDFYNSYSERTRQNLKKLNEDVVDFDLLEDLVCYIDETHPPGAILVFLPGVAEIDLLVDKLTASFRFGGMTSDWILPLHSSLASADQRKVFLTPPENIRKVIVATDIAETSITIDDVTYVVDSGKHKENRYNSQKKMSSMVEDWISQANAKQRRGRAGRVKPGVCFCLYTCHRFEALMRPFQVPEMLRMPLTELCLQIKSLSLGEIKSFLLEALEPPREETISSAVDLLHRVGAFEGDEELSPLGYHLAKLPVDVMVGKMMLYGAIFGCLSPILSVAAFLSHKSPFVYSKDEKQNVERAKATLWSGSLDIGSTSSEGKKQSDHLLLAVAYSKWAKILHESGVKAAQQFCRSFFLNSSVMYMIREMRIQFGTLLADIGLISLPKLVQSDGKRKDKLDSWIADMSQPFNVNANHSSIIKSILCAGLYPNVAATTEGTVLAALGSNKGLNNEISVKDHAIWYDGRREVHIHPSSVNYSIKGVQYPFLVFLEKVETSKIFLRDTSIISPYSILLFGGSILVQHQAGLVIIDGWLKLTAPAQTAVLFKELRLTLHTVLKELIRKPEMATISNNEVLRSIVHLLLEEDNA